MAPRGVDRRKPSTDQKTTRRQMQINRTGSQEETIPMNTTEREVQLIQAMGKATPSEQVVILAELDEIRAERTVTQGGIDFSQTRTASRLAAVPTFSHHTSATDWMGTMASAPEDTTAVHHAMRTEATMWFQRLGSAVKADRDEFAEQAMGMALVKGSQYGEASPEAQRTFLDTAARLHRMAEEQSGNAASGLPLAPPQHGYGDQEAGVLDTFQPPVAPENAAAVAEREGEGSTVAPQVAENQQETPERTARRRLAEINGKGQIVTEDGQDVNEGDRVFNYYDMKWGTIANVEAGDDPWFDVLQEDGTKAYLDGSRISTFDPREKNPHFPYSGPPRQAVLGSVPGERIVPRTSGLYAEVDIPGIGIKSVEGPWELSAPIHGDGTWIVYGQVDGLSTAVYATDDEADARSFMESHPMLNPDSGEQLTLASRKTAGEETVCASCGKVIVQGEDAPGKWYHRDSGVAGWVDDPADAAHKAIPREAKIAAESEADQSGNASSSLPDVEVASEGDKPMWPWELDEQGKNDAGAADVAGTATPGQNVADYPQPTGGTTPPAIASAKTAGNAIVDDKYPVPCVVVRRDHKSSSETYDWGAVVIWNGGMMADVTRGQTLEKAMSEAMAYGSANALAVVDQNGDYAMNPSAIASRKQASGDWAIFTADYFNGLAPETMVAGPYPSAEEATQAAISAGYDLNATHYVGTTLTDIPVEQVQTHVEDTIAGSSGVTGRRRTAADGATCATCGDSIARDPEGEANRTWHHTNGTSHDHEAKPSGGSTEARRRVSVKVAGVALTNVTIADRAARTFKGKDPSGKEVTFQANEKDAADLIQVMTSDLAINFSGVTVDESEIISQAHRRTAGINWTLTYSEPNWVTDDGDVATTPNGTIPMEYIAKVPEGELRVYNVIGGWLWQINGKNPNAAPLVEFNGSNGDPFGPRDGLGLDEAKAAVEAAYASWPGKTSSTRTAGVYDDVQWQWIDDRNGPMGWFSDAEKAEHEGTPDFSAGHWAPVGQADKDSMSAWYTEQASIQASRRTAGVYCKTHDVWVGDGNASTHTDCSKEQRATEKTKDASLSARQAAFRQTVQTSLASRRPFVREAMPSPAELNVSVGDIFYGSWGYDQTNVNFYEVTGLTGASVKIREVGQIQVGDSGPSESVVPDKGNYIGPEMTKRLKSGYQGSAAIRVNDVISAWAWDGKPKHRTGYGWGH